MMGASLDSLGAGTATCGGLTPALRGTHKKCEPHIRYGDCIEQSPGLFGFPVAQRSLSDTLDKPLSSLRDNQIGTIAPFNLVEGCWDCTQDRGSNLRASILVCA